MLRSRHLRPHGTAHRSSRPRSSRSSERSHARRSSRRTARTSRSSHRSRTTRRPSRAARPEAWTRAARSSGPRAPESAGASDPLRSLRSRRCRLSRLCRRFLRNRRLLWLWCRLPDLRCGRSWLLLHRCRRSRILRCRCLWPRLGRGRRGRRSRFRLRRRSSGDRCRRLGLRGRNDVGRDLRDHVGRRLGGRGGRLRRDGRRLLRGLGGLAGRLGGNIDRAADQVLGRAETEPERHLLLARLVVLSPLSLLSSSPPPLLLTLLPSTVSVRGSCRLRLDLRWSRPAWILTSLRTMPPHNRATRGPLRSYGAGADPSSSSSSSFSRPTAAVCPRIHANYFSFSANSPMTSLASVTITT